MALRKNYTPIIALVGFLGSGKTTLLNHILTENQGLKIGVIVNDFGDINIDAMLVARQTEKELELSNGCICCSLEGSSLDEAIAQLAHTGSTVECIIIEASGLAEPRELLRMLVHTKNDFARFDSMIAVVDASNVLSTKEAHPEFVEQINVADCIIINKLDLISAKEKQKVREYLAFIGAPSLILEAEHGKIDTRLLLDPETRSIEERQLSLGAPETNHDTHLHHTYQKVSFSEKQPIDPKLWETFVAQMDSGIYRAKGFLYFGMKGLGQKFLFQKVGARSTMKLDEWVGTEPRTNLVFIGPRIDEKKLKEQLQGLVDKDPDSLTNDTIIDVLQYK